MAVSVGLVVIGLLALGVGVASSGEGHRGGRVRPSAESLGVSIQAVFDARGRPGAGRQLQPRRVAGDGRVGDLPARRPSCHSVGPLMGSSSPDPSPLARGSWPVPSTVARPTARATGSAPCMRSVLRASSASARWAAWSSPWPGPGVAAGAPSPTSLALRRVGPSGATTAGCSGAASTGARMAARARLGGWFTSWYLFAVDARMPRDDVCAGTGYFDNADLPPWRLGPTIVRSAALARIAGPPRPTVRIWHRAIQRGDTLLVASLHCATRCKVKIDVFDRLRWISHRLTLVGRRHVGVARGALRHGALRVTIHVDDSSSITGRSRFS